MQVECFNYQKEKGWSINPFPPLDSPNTLILAFCAPEFFTQVSLFNELRTAYPSSHLAGCSTAGEIFKTTINDHSIAIAVIKFDNSTLTVLTEEVLEAEQSFSIGMSLGEKLKKPDLKSVLVLSDGLIVNGSALTEGFKKSLPAGVIITGGLAGDGKEFKKTWTLKGEKPGTQGVTAIGFYGKNLNIGYGSKGGWDIFGPERLITRSKGNVLFEIDGQPALTLYKKYLGERAAELPASGLLFPLAISEKPFSNKQVVRSILSVNEEEKSITFAGDLPQGWYAQLMRANFDRLIDGASTAVKLAKKDRQDTQNSLAIAISCVGRRLVLGERSEEEIEAALEILGSNANMVGFYSYGEISPSGLDSCDLHNQTMTITLISEN